MYYFLVFYIFRIEVQKRKRKKIMFLFVEVCHMKILAIGNFFVWRDRCLAPRYIVCTSCTFESEGRVCLYCVNTKGIY